MLSMKEVLVPMRKLPAVVSLLLAASTLHAAPPATHPAAPTGWQARVAQAMPLLGHRNWILIVDSAYPLQSSPGVETVETNADQIEVVRYVLGTIGSSIHVRPVVLMDAELPFVTEEDAPGVMAYQEQIGKVLDGFPVEAMLHEKVIANIDEAGRQFQVLVLKTTMALPYTSVFIRLDCKYWSADAEERLRARMPAEGVTPAQSPAEQPAPSPDQKPAQNPDEKPAQNPDDNPH